MAQLERKWTWREYKCRGGRREMNDANFCHNNTSSGAWIAPLFRSSQSVWPVQLREATISSLRCPPRPWPGRTEPQCGLFFGVVFSQPQEAATGPLRSWNHRFDLGFDSVQVFSNAISSLRARGRWDAPHQEICFLVYEWMKVLMTLGGAWPCLWESSSRLWRPWQGAAQGWIANWEPQAAAQASLSPRGQRGPSFTSFHSLITNLIKVCTTEIEYKYDGCFILTICSRWETLCEIIV